MSPTEKKRCCFRYYWNCCRFFRLFQNCFCCCCSLYAGAVTVTRHPLHQDSNYGLLRTTVGHKGYRVQCCQGLTDDRHSRTLISLV